MKQKSIFVAVSILILASMLLSACGNGTPAATATTAPVVVATTAVPTVAPTEAPKASWFDTVVFSAIADPEPAVAQIQAGAIDLYSATIDKADVYKTVLADPTLKASNTYGSSNQLLLNTVVCTDKTLLNPFSDMKIREAMNWVVDRNYVVQEIFGGLAKAKYNPFTTAFPDYARYADLFSAVETKNAYNFDKAKAVVDAEMPTLGATLGADGKWQFGGKPVVIIGLIRTEDKRKEIGNYFANQLEKLGFTVNREEKIRKEAAPIWQGDPLPCAFNFYTAGWISPQIYRDEGLNFIQYNTGELQQIPVMNAYQPSAELAAAEKKLYTNSFSTMDERRDLFKTSLDLSMTESWWGVWVNDSIAFEVSNAKVYGASDLAGGFAGAQIFPYTAGITGQEGGALRIANSAVLVDAFNPISGSNWIDDTIVRNFTTDYGVIYNPYTGLVMPKLVAKADVVALTGLPIAAPQSDWVSLKFQDAITVPDTAWVDWDAKTQKFITAAEAKAADPKWAGGTAKTMTTVVYSPDVWKETWHDGTPLTEADFVFAMIMTFDPGKKDSKIYDESIGAAVETYLTHFKGVQITSTDPLTIVTYDDQYSLDAENNVKDWFPNIYGVTGYAGGMLAWHNLTPMVQAVADGKMAFSKDAADSKKIDYASQISGPTLDVQMAYVDQDITAKYIPYAATMGDYLKPDDAVTAYNNLKAFYSAHKHIMLGTGPYMVDQVYPVEGSIKLVKYPAYPFPAGQFAQFAEPELMTMAVDGPTTVTIGQAATFNVTINFNDKPYPSKDINKVSFTLFNSDGSILGTGDATFVAEGQYTVTVSADLAAKLTEGTAKITVAAASNAVSLPAFETAEFVVTK
jgi:peptide/nickel transport system substrate-binding protein